MRCSFCNKAEADVRKLIAGPSVFICNECVDICAEILARDPHRQERADAESGDPRSRRPPGSSRVRCGLCGIETTNLEVLPIEGRGVLCGACADAVDDALAGGT